jgi:hypothetical protein
MAHDWFEQFASAASVETQALVREAVASLGYPAFYQIVEGFTGKMKSFADADTAEVEALLARGRTLFPEPVRFSPSWEKLWDELEQVARFKKEALASVPVSERDGEWQVIMDNPYSNQEVVCYPALTFMEGAYLYGYFRQQLEKNEYIRLQKVQTLLMSYGR